MNPEGVEEEIYTRASGDCYEGLQQPIEESEVGISSGAANDVGTSAEQIAALEAELADVKSLNANIATAIRQITRQFEEAMVAGLIPNGTGGISDGWSAVDPQTRVPIGSYGGVPMFRVDPPSTPGEYDFVMTLGPVGETIMTPISDRARNDEIHKLHRMVLALRGMLIAAGMRTELLDQVLGDVNCASCHLNPIEPGTGHAMVQGFQEAADRRSQAQRIVDEYETRVGRRSEDSLARDVAGLRAREAQTAEEADPHPVDARDLVTVMTGRSPRHRMKLTLMRLFEEWDIGGFDHDGLNDPLPSNAVLARRVVDLLDSDKLLLGIYMAGLKRGIARASHPGDSFAVAEAMPTVGAVKRMFEKYWLGR